MTLQGFVHKSVGKKGHRHVHCPHACMDMTLQRPLNNLAASKRVLTSFQHHCTSWSSTWAQPCSGALAGWWACHTAASTHSPWSACLQPSQVRRPKAPSLAQLDDAKQCARLQQQHVMPVDPSNTSLPVSQDEQRPFDAQYKCRSSPSSEISKTQLRCLQRCMVNGVLTC